MLWLLLVPLVGRVWHFFVVSGMANSLESEFTRRNIPPVAERPGYSIGVAMCVFRVCVFIPGLGILAEFAGLVLWIIYWSKIAEFSRRLETIPFLNVMSEPPL